MLEVLKQFILLKSLACSWLRRICYIWLPEKEVVSFALIALAPNGDLLAFVLIQLLQFSCCSRRYGVLQSFVTKIPNITRLITSQVPAARGRNGGLPPRKRIKMVPAITQVFFIYAPTCTLSCVCLVSVPVTVSGGSRAINYTLVHHYR